MENDPSAFLLILSQSSLDMASLQVFASTIVCAKTAGTEPIAKAPEIKPAVKSVRRAIVGPPPVPKGCTEHETHARLNCCGAYRRISGSALPASLTPSWDGS